MSRILIAGALILALGVPGFAASDAAKAWKRAQRDIGDREEAYWDEFRDRSNAVYMDWTGKLRFWRSDPEAFKDEVLPLDDLRLLYADYAAIQEDAARHDLFLAESGAEDALEVLWDAYLDLAKDVDDLEKELAEARPTGGFARYEQEPSVRRHGLAVRMAGLRKALARAPGVAAFLAEEGLEDAEKGDRHRSTVRTAGALDVLGLLDDPVAHEALRKKALAEEPFVRIVALEHLLPRGLAPPADFDFLLADASPAVRRAALQTLARSDAFAWIPTLVRELPAARGLEREWTVRALEALSGARRGDDPASWLAWLEANGPAIEAGTFARPEPEAESGEAEAGKAQTGLRTGAALTFYGLPAPSARAIFVVPGGDDMALPADLSLQKRHSKHHWRSTGPRWRDDAMDHRALLLSELERTLLAAPETARVSVIHLFGSTPSRIAVHGDRRPIEPSKGKVRSLLAKVGKPKANGQLSVEEGLRRAIEISGLDPFEDPDDPAETPEILYVVDTGWNGGRWPLPELLIAAFERENRFRRLPVYAIRIADEKEEAEALMEGLAEASDGAYRWLTELP
jgi:hypothetical protein